MIEEYNGYSGNIYNGIITNNNGITFSNLNAGKYEISENAQLLFKFIDFNKISSTENISLTNENGKYYITISEFITTNQSIEIELTNKIIENRFYVDFKDKKNLFKFI